MRQYLSYGAGVGSTALLCHMLDDIRSGNVDVVFCDHGADWPETYDYVEYIQKTLKITITVLKVEIQGSKGLYNFYMNHNTIPFYRYRICTDKSKIRPFNKYIERPCNVFLGITWDERKRAKPNKTKTITSCYPFVEDRISRDRAIRIIENTGLKIPNKSGCYFCPFQGKAEWKRLFDEHNDLFIKAICLEDNANNRILPTGRSLQSLYDEFKFQSTLMDAYV
jgi:hypothetical protein